MNFGWLCGLRIRGWIWGVDYGWVSVFRSELVVFELGAGIRCYGSGFLLYVLIYFFHIIMLQDFREREQTEFQFRSTIQTIARKEPNTTTSELGERGILKQRREIFC
jgi:hypothetical protein